MSFVTQVQMVGDTITLTEGQIVEWDELVDCLVLQDNMRSDGTVLHDGELTDVSVGYVEEKNVVVLSFQEQVIFPPKVCLYLEGCGVSDGCLEPKPLMELTSSTRIAIFDEETNCIDRFTTVAELSEYISDKVKSELTACDFFKKNAEGEIEVRDRVSSDNLVVIDTASCLLETVDGQCFDEYQQWL